jgi:hypothetical protein
MILEYWIKKYGQTEGDAYKINWERMSIDDELDERFAAQECADDFHSNHDGWESPWPLTFHVKAEGKFLGVFEIERDYLPVFYAEKK